MTLVQVLLIAIFLAAGAYAYAVVFAWVLSAFQLEHYSRARIETWSSRMPQLLRARLIGIVIALAGIACAGIADASPGATVPALAVLAIGSALLAHRVGGFPGVGGPGELVLTGRAKRLVAVGYALPVVLVVALLAIFAVMDSIIGALIATSALGVLIALPRLAIVTADWLLAPVQQYINGRYVRAARRTLEASDVIKVGITGSYGKTSTKSIARQLIEGSMTVCATPASFNSFLGTVRAVNEVLGDEDVFLSEMGVYRIGDVAELCELVKPTIGILTAIGPMHLERLGSIERIRDAKAELAAGLPDDGLFIANGDDELVRGVAENARSRTFLYGMHSDGLDLVATNVSVSPTGTSFDLCHGDERHRCESPLLGDFNVLNVLAGCSLGIALGIPLGDLAARVSGLEPTPHRMQLMPPAGDAGVTVIDNSYSSNPKGAMGALKILGSFTGGRRVMVFPGMIELGDAAESAHREVARCAADNCDEVILVGNNVEDFRAELVDCGFDQARIHSLASRDQVEEFMAGFCRPRDVVLFENDLPPMHEAVPA